METRAIALHVPAACAFPNPVYGTVQARGDFAPTPSEPAEDTVRLDDGVIFEHLPAYARALYAGVVHQPPNSAVQHQWIAAGLIPERGDVDLLLWPDDEACGLSATMPMVENPAIGATSRDRVLIVGGGLTLEDNRFPRSFVADLTTGRVTPMANGPTTSRARATLTRFGSGALLAGGARSDDPNSLLDTAEIWSEARNDFDLERVTLSRPRTEHAAVELSSGDTLLVGGISTSGSPIGALERVSLSERRASQTDLAFVEPRRAPFALRLANDEILIAGGTDAMSRPSSRVEILTPDARSRRSSVELLAGAITAQQWVPLSGGGALAVITSTLAVSNVWRLSADGAPVQLPAIGVPLGDFKLFPGACGGAMLWTGSAWQIFDPWADRFRPADFGARGPEDLASLAPDPSQIVWLAREGGQMRIIGRRLSLRNAFSSEEDPLSTLTLCNFASSVPRLRPLAPDRSPASAGITLANGQVSLPEGASATITDARYLDFALEISVSGAAPDVVLRNERGAYTIGGQDCALAASASQIRVERAGPLVRVNDAACRAPIFSGRVQIALGGHGTPTNTTVKAVRVRRLAPLPSSR